MSKSISWFCAETLPEQDAPKWKQSAGVDEKGEIYVPAIIAGEEKKIFFDSEWDDEPIAILDDHLFVQSKWVKKNYPNTEDALKKIEKSLTDKLNFLTFLKVAVLGSSDTLYIGVTNEG